MPESQNRIGAAQQGWYSTMPQSTLAHDLDAENAIIAVVTVYIGTSDSPRAESLFPGALCWYTEPPEELEADRKRKRGTHAPSEWEMTPFVTTQYAAGARFAGVCISWSSNKPAYSSVGIVVSGAITIKLPKPEEDGDELPRAEPGMGVYFGDDGKIEFGEPTGDLLSYCVRALLRRNADDIASPTPEEINGISDAESTTADLLHRMTGIEKRDIERRLGELTKMSLPPFSRRERWARVLDTGTMQTVRLLLKLA